MYELIAGRRAFESLAAVLRDYPKPLEAPAGLQRIVARCLRKHPAERFESMAAVKAALEAFVRQPTGDQPSIAVLPFANMSADKEQEYFSDGLTEEIINALGQIPGLKVSARTRRLRSAAGPRRGAFVPGTGNRSRPRASQALALDPDEPQAHMALGAVAGWRDFDWNRAGEHFRRALAVEPVSCDIRSRYAGYYLMPLGRLTEAKQQMEKVLDADPLGVLWRAVLGLVLSAMGRYEDAIIEAQKALEINRESWIEMQWMSISYAALGKLDQARRAAEEVVQFAPWNFMAVGHPAGIWARAGGQVQAEPLLQRIPDDRRKPGALACYHLQRGDIDALAHWYEKAIEQHGPMAFLNQASAPWRPLRESRHWPRLAKMMNLPETG